MQNWRVHERQGFDGSSGMWRGMMVELEKQMHLQYDKTGELQNEALTPVMEMAARIAMKSICAQARCRMVEC
jgi:hypothetical protein